MSDEYRPSLKISFYRENCDFCSLGPGMGWQEPGDKRPAMHQGQGINPLSRAKMVFKMSLVVMENVKKKKKKRRGWLQKAYREARIGHQWETAVPSRPGMERERDNN